MSTYLTHHGYCSTAESFVRTTGETFDEELVSIRNRQSKSVIAGEVFVLMVCVCDVCCQDYWKMASAIIVKLYSSMALANR